jgi:prolycopene isomerase
LSTDYDAIVIGSGIGGLTCGALLAQKGLRVAVLERHSRIGGYAQEFSRDKYVFDSSVHSVSMANDGFVCGLLNQLGIRDRLTIVPNTCTALVRSPGFTYSLPANLDALTRCLCSDFPHEKESVCALLDDMQRLFHQYKGNFATGGETMSGRSGTIAEVTRSYKDYIRSFVSDERLRCLLGSIWPFGGSSPAYAPFYNAFIFIAHALEGSHSIKGGFALLARALAEAITSRGGEVRTRWPVRAFRMDDAGVVAAVVGDRGEELTAATFVSNVSPYLLHGQLIPEPFRNRLWQKRLAKLSPSVSAVSVYLGLDGDPAAIAKDNLTFWFASMDHDAIYRRIQSSPTGDIDHLLVMHLPGSAGGGCITLMHFVKQRPGIAWREEKKRIADAMIKKAASVFGDFTAGIRVCEVASPDTFERYTGNTAGALYGFENTHNLYGQSKLPFTTYLPNLFQVGHWTKAGGGIYNVMSSGYVAASIILHQ